MNSCSLAFLGGDAMKKSSLKNLWARSTERWSARYVSSRIGDSPLSREAEGNILILKWSCI